MGGNEVLSDSRVVSAALTSNPNGPQFRRPSADRSGLEHGNIGPRPLQPDSFGRIAEAPNAGLPTPLNFSGKFDLCPLVSSNGTNQNRSGGAVPTSSGHGNPIPRHLFTAINRFPR